MIEPDIIFIDEAPGVSDDDWNELKNIIKKHHPKTAEELHEVSKQEREQ